MSSPKTVKAFDLRDLDAEREVLGALFVDDRVFDRLEEQGLTARDFGDERHALLYAAMQETKRAGLQLDPRTIATALRDAGTLDKAGGLRAIGQAFDNWSCSSHADFYARRIRERAATRAMLNAQHDLGTAIVAGEQHEVRGALELCQKLERELASLRNEGKGADEWQALNAAWLDKQLDENTPDTPRVSTGFPALDEALDGGFAGGQLIMLLAPPKSGKSFLAFQGFVSAALKAKVRTCGFSLEMPKEEQLVRWYVSETGIAPRAFSKRDTRAHQVAALIAAHHEIAQWPLHLFDIGEVNSAGDVSARTMAVHRKNPVGLVVVDHLLFLDNGRRADDPRVDIETSTRALKRLAVETNAPVVCLAHPTQDASRSKTKMGLFDGKGSLSIAGDCDVMLEVRIDNSDPSKKDLAGRYPARLAIVGGRNVAELKSFDWRFRGSHYRFEEAF